MWTFGQLFSLFNLVNEILLPYMVQYSYDQTREVGCCSVTQLCPTLCDPMDCSTPGLPVHHHLLELAQSHVHWVNDAIQPSEPQSPPSHHGLSLSQHQCQFQRVSYSHQVAKVLQLQPQINPPNEYSGLISFRIDWFDLLAVQRSLLKSLLQHHTQFKSINSLALCLFYSPILTFIQDYWKNRGFD